VVRFYIGTELSKKLQLSVTDKDKCYDFINKIIDNLYLYRNKDLPFGFHPIFDLFQRLNKINSNVYVIEKILKYHILSSDYRGYKFLEYLLAIETSISLSLSEHPYQIFHKLISYLGEDYIFLNKILENKNSYFKNKYDIIDIKKYYTSKKSNELKDILILTQKQLEYLLLDLNPIFIKAGLRLLPDEYQNKILSCYTDYNRDLINFYPEPEEFNFQLGEEFIDFLISRLKGFEKNSFELRRNSYYYSRLYKGNDFTYRLNSNSKQKTQLKEIILIFLGISGKIREVGLKNTLELVEVLNSEEYFYLKVGLTFVLEGWQPSNIRYIMENLILVGDYKGGEFLKRILIIDGCHLLSLNISEQIILEKFIQTIGEENKEEIEEYINEATSIVY
jgi:hypothetical protein